MGFKPFGPLVGKGEALFQPMGSLWDVMGENRKGIAVMRLVASHRNTPPAIREALQRRSESANSRTPR
jgi:hypothetical protein